MFYLFVCKFLPFFYFSTYDHFVELFHKLKFFLFGNKCLLSERIIWLNLLYAFRSDNPLFLVLKLLFCFGVLTNILLAKILLVIVNFVYSYLI